MSAAARAPGRRAELLFVVAVATAALLGGRLIAIAAVTCSIMLLDFIQRRATCTAGQSRAVATSPAQIPKPECCASSSSGHAVRSADQSDEQSPSSPCCASVASQAFTPQRTIAGFAPLRGPPAPLVLPLERSPAACSSPPPPTPSVPPSPFLPANPLSRNSPGGPSAASMAASAAGHPGPQVSAPRSPVSPLAPSSSPLYPPPPSPMPLQLPSPITRLLRRRKNQQRRNCATPPSASVEGTPEPSPSSGAMVAPPAAEEGGAEGGWQMMPSGWTTQSGPLLPCGPSEGGGLAPLVREEQGPDTVGEAGLVERCRSWPVASELECKVPHSAPLSSGKGTPRGSSGWRTVRIWASSPRVGKAKAHKTPPSPHVHAVSKSPEKLPRRPMQQFGGLLKAKAPTAGRLSPGPEPLRPRVQTLGHSSARNRAVFPLGGNTVAACRPVPGRRSPRLAIAAPTLPQAAICRAESLPASPTLHTLKLSPPHVVKVVEEVPPAPSRAAAAAIPVIGGAAAGAHQAGAADLSALSRERRQRREVRVVASAAVAVVLCSLFLGPLPAIVATVSVGVMVYRISRTRRVAGSRNGRSPIAANLGLQPRPLPEAAAAFTSDWSLGVLATVEEEVANGEAADWGGTVGPRSPVEAILQHSSATDERTQAILAGLLDRPRRRSG